MENNYQQLDPAPRQEAGLKENIACLGCYLGGWITGFIFLMLDRNRPAVRFHAAQSLVLFGGFHVLSIILSWVPGSDLLLVALGLAWMALWIYMMHKGYQVKIYKLPYVGDWAEKIAAA